ncbi:STAS domain-containing protein [Paenibacillus sp. CMAA1364]
MNTNKTEKFNARVETIEGQSTVYLTGELDLSVSTDFRVVMEPLISNSDIDLIVNMNELKYIDSTGIGILLSILKTRHSMSSKFKVVEIPQQIQKLFDMTGIAKFFEAEEKNV